MGVDRVPAETPAGAGGAFGEVAGTLRCQRPMPATGGRVATLPGLSRRIVVESAVIGR